ncbi:MAG TPA: alanine--tRNA ligase [Thermoleophilaceae bacterium]|nr:alanine--tRNA ligase [Thermoleophilaceae bacterium]
MQSAEIRERYLGFFEERGHRRMPSASLVPASFDPTVLLTTAGMQPFKPYFRGEEKPPSPRLTSCQKVFRTTDIENVGLTARHLTFFEMLGNFSVGDYFKQGAAEFAWELSTQGFGFDPEQIWITVFGGDEELGVGPDDEAIEVWRAIGIPDERIVRLGMEDNFWQSGPTGPCGPCSELYLDRGLDFGSADDLPGDDTERFLEYWNLVFMQFELHGDGSLTDLPQQNIDTGLGLDRMAAILQDVPSVFETDLFAPMIEFGEQRSGRRSGQDFTTTRALRILADHGRGATFLMADGVVPSNEDRGYILRRILRRAIQQGRRLGIADGFLPDLCQVVIDKMGEPYPQLHEERDTIMRWAAAEEEGFGRTLAQGERLLADLIEKARGDGAQAIPAEEAFRLHDTFGFPFELTTELLAEQGLGVDQEGFAGLMEQARVVARGEGRGGTGESVRERAAGFAKGTGFTTNFVGYESTEAETVLRALQRDNPPQGRTGGSILAKLEDSPFYAEGGGQVSDGGLVETPSGRARVADVVRLGSDQALALEPLEGDLVEGERVHAVVERDARLATMRNHTATHLLHAALRERLGTHVRQAGSYVGPDKLRFDFTHGERMSSEDLHAVEERVNGWIAASRPVRAIETSLDEAKRLGAMALFGEKYGDWVRMVEVADVSRELCGGTHVAATAEVGLFHITNETSSASNVRRIEAVTGPEATRLFEERTALLRDLSSTLKVSEGELAGAVERLGARVKELQKKPAGQDGAAATEELVGAAADVAGVPVVTARSDVGDAKELLALSDRVRQKLGDAVVVLGTAADGRVHLVAQVAPALTERGLKAGQIIKVAAEVAGGGGGGRDTMAQAGGRDPDKLDDALDAARTAIQTALS